MESHQLLGSELLRSGPDHGCRQLELPRDCSQLRQMGARLGTRQPHPPAHRHHIARRTTERRTRLDPLSDLIPAVIRKLPDFELVDPAQVPMVTGVLMAAAMGMDTVAWRDQFGTIPSKEALVHNFVLWLLADLFDSLVEQPGAADQLMQETFNSMAAGPG